MSRLSIFPEYFVKWKDWTGSPAAAISSGRRQSGLTLTGAVRLKQACLSLGIGPNRLQRHGIVS